MLSDNGTFSLTYLLRRTIFPTLKRHISYTTFNIASEASYVYILSGQRSLLKGQKLMKNAKNEKFLDILGNFPVGNMVLLYK